MRPGITIGGFLLVRRHCAGPGHRVADHPLTRWSSERSVSRLRRKLANFDMRTAAVQRALSGACASYRGRLEVPMPSSAQQLTRRELIVKATAEARAWRFSHLACT